jgi:hypothetical protein
LKESERSNPNEISALVENASALTSYARINALTRCGAPLKNEQEQRSAGFLSDS